jgi:hypothetical protein
LRFGGRGGRGAEAGDEEGGGGEGGEGEEAPGPGEGAGAEVGDVAEHLDSPEEGVARREEGPRGAEDRALVGTEGHASEGREVAFLAAGEGGGEGVGGELLVEPEAGVEPVGQGVVPGEGEADLGPEGGGIVGASDVGQFMSEYGDELMFLPRCPVGREEEGGAEPADGGGGGEVVGGEGLDGSGAAQVGADEVEGFEEGGVGDGAGPATEALDGEEAEGKSGEAEGGDGQEE